MRLVLQPGGYRWSFVQPLACPLAATAARAAIELEREAVMERRRFLSRTIAGAVGLAAAGAVLGSGGLDRAELERDDSAIPDGPARALGRRQLIWAVPTSAPLAALTFDDGPDPELTPRILAILARYDVRATFTSWATTPAGTATWFGR